MRAITTTELSRMKATQQGSFFDACTIDSYTESTDEYGSLTSSYTSGSSISAGYDANPGSKSWGSSTVKQTYDAVFRVDEEETVSAQDRITLTALAGVDVTPIQYQIKSIEMGKGVLILGCISVEA